MTEPGNINQLLPKGQDWIPRELADLRRQIRRLTGGTHSAGGGGGITAFGFFVVDDTSAFTTDLSLQGHMTDDGSDPGFWQATPGPDYGVDVLVDGTWGAHMNIRIHDADPGDVFVADMTQGGGGENGLFAATFIADSTGVAKCGGPCAPVRAFGFSYPLTLFQATVSQISGTGTAPDLQFFNMTMFKYA